MVRFSFILREHVLHDVYDGRVPVGEQGLDPFVRFHHHIFYDEEVPRCRIEFPRQSFLGHMSVQLRRFGQELVLLASTRVPSHGLVLYQIQQVPSVGIVPDNRPTWPSNLSVLDVTYFGDPNLVIALKKLIRSRQRHDRF